MFFILHSCIFFILSVLSFHHLVHGDIKMPSLPSHRCTPSFAEAIPCGLLGANVIFLATNGPFHEIRLRAVMGSSDLLIEPEPRFRAELWKQVDVRNRIGG
jgi:hypothetical protein